MQLGGSRFLFDQIALKGKHCISKRKGETKSLYRLLHDSKNSGHSL